MKNIFLVALVLGLSATAAAQTSNAGGAGECKLKLPQAPAIRGIHLGMTINEVLAVFPGAEKNESLRRRLSESRFGVSTANVAPFLYESKAQFVGVRSVDVGLLDGALNFFSFIYDSPDWKSDEQLASKIAEALNLPGVELWKRQTQFGKALGCDGFEVKVQRTPESGAAIVSVRNLEKDVNKIPREREEAVKEDARRAFKP